MKYNKILKPKKFDNFTIIPSYIFRDKGISVGATGLYAYLFSHTAEQEITIQFICGHFKESKGAIGRKLNELIDAGYVNRKRVTDKGKFKGYNYILKAKPKTQKPEPQKPKPQNEPQSNIIYNNNIRFKKPLIFEIKEYCLERNNNIDAESFYDFYESKNWFVGKNKMKDWKACIRTRERRNKPKTSTSKLDAKISK